MPRSPGIAGASANRQASGRPIATAIIVAAGRGERLGRPAKILLPLADRPMLSYSLDAVQASSAVRDIVVVVGEHTIDAVQRLLQQHGWSKITGVVLGGERRQDSVAAGIAVVAKDVEIVVVHDAARPFAGSFLFDRCVEAASRCGAAIVAIPVSDTIKRVVDGQIQATVSREGLWAAQTPQAMRRDLLHDALARAQRERVQVTDEAGLLEALGIPVAVVPGSTRNLKITHPGDIEVAEAMIVSGTTTERSSALTLS